MSGRKDSEPIMTIIFVVINVLVFVVLEIMGDTQNSEFMAEHGAVWPPYVSEGHEYWRLLTATFMHFGFEHIANNMLILVCAGMILEKALGHVKFTILYLIAGVGGNVLSCAQMLHTKDYAVAAGASGAIFGIVGALLWIVILHRGRYESLTGKGLLFMIVIKLPCIMELPPVELTTGGILEAFLWALLWESFRIEELILGEKIHILKSSRIRRRCA